jgi:ATP-dependent exoDNAse (exonuclease V) beta subunit
VRIRETLPHQPLFSAVGEIVRMTQLRERLRTMPRGEFGDSVNELEKLLTAAAAAEAQQNSLADFALTLRRNFDKIRETEPEETDAIQLITAHKAKGSEWDAVIVPFLAREARLGGNIRYPLVIPGEEPFIAFDRSDKADLEDELKKIQRQEMERLLYVALTRARHTLVFALDADFFRGKRGVHSDTQLKWLKADAGEPNAEAMAAASEEAEICEETAAHHKRRKSEPVSESLSALQLETGWIDIARQRAGTIIETVSPSQFAPEKDMGTETPSTEEWIEIEPELRPPRIDNPATRYGVWWHDFAEQLIWVRAGLAFNSSELSRLWEKTFQANITSSPDQARSKREWQLLQKQIESGEELARKLGATNLIRQEMPFFWRTNSKSLEGIVDLALFTQTANEFFILDWKTNRIAADEIDMLRDLYRPQMAAYWQAISNLTDARVTAAIYSTATGQLVIYDDAELITEWQRLATTLS